MLALSGAAVVLLGLLTVFAIELSNTQAKSKRDIEARVHERSVLAAALIDSLVQTVQLSVAHEQVRFGARVVSTRTMNASRQQNAYVALLDASGRVLASSTGFSAQARAELSRSTAVALVRQGQAYGLGNVLPYGRGTVIDLAVALETSHGPRMLVTGFTPAALGLFLAGELQKIPGVSGAHNYVLDGANTVLASNNPAVPAGSRLTRPAEVNALRRASGESNGRYYDQVGISHSTWRIVLSAPDGPLFAAVSGVRKWVPWLIFIALAIVAAVALLLGLRVVRSAESSLRKANVLLATANRDLAVSNRALEERAEELARSNAELEQFASIASHDLQEPLRKVRTFTEQVSATESERLSERSRDYLRRANSAAERMQRLIQDLLQFSRVTTQARPFSAVDLDEIAHETLDDLSVEVERSGATVSIGPLPMIIADGLQIRQLFQNLITNALKFRREGVPAEIAIEATRAGDEVQITFKDNGIGFEPQYSDRIFRVFERLHGRSAMRAPASGLRCAARSPSGTAEASPRMASPASDRRSP